MGLYEIQKTDKVLKTLSLAVRSRNPSPGLICHSDKGSQMTSYAYRRYLSKHNFVFSYTSINHSCDENAAQESFHAQLKKRMYIFNKNIYI